MRNDDGEEVRDEWDEVTEPRPPAPKPAPDTARTPVSEYRHFLPEKTVPAEKHYNIWGKKADQDLLPLRSFERQRFWHPVPARVQPNSVQKKCLVRLLTGTQEGAALASLILYTRITESLLEFIPEADALEYQAAYRHGWQNGWYKNLWGSQVATLSWIKLQHEYPGINYSQAFKVTTARYRFLEYFADFFLWEESGQLVIRTLALVYPIPEPKFFNQEGGGHELPKIEFRGGWVKWAHRRRAGRK